MVDGLSLIIIELMRDSYYENFFWDKILRIIISLLKIIMAILEKNDLLIDE
jgi:hypothetical protein